MSMFELLLLFWLGEYSSAVFLGISMSRYGRAVRDKDSVLVGVLTSLCSSA